MNFFKIYISIIFSLILCFTTYATDYHVSNSGSNSNSGLTLTDAFLTIQHAADLVAAGDIVYVENGVYTGFDLRNVNGTSSNPITFKASGTNVIINQSGPIRDDIINIEDADYIIIDGFTTNNAPGNGNGIRVVVSDFCIVKNNSCDNNAERGIFTAFTDDILIEHNICSNSIDEHGIYVSNSSDRPIIRYNECYGNNSIGIHMNGDLSAGGDGIISDAQIYGNILHDNNHAAGINMDGLENPIVYNNLIYNNHFSQGIALFQGDGAGTNIASTIVTQDIELATRPFGPAYDIGAYEYNILYINGNFGQIKIFPNPTSNFIKLEYDETNIAIEKINIVTINGKQVKSINSNHLINVKDLSTGIYFIQIYLSDQTIISKKIMIE